MKGAWRSAVLIACVAAAVGLGGVVRSDGGDGDPTTALVQVSAVDTPAFLDDGDAHSLREAIRQSLAWLAGQPAERPIAFGNRVLTVADQRQALRRMLELLADNPPAEVLEARVNAEFELLKSIGRADGMMLVTGYHEPIIDASDVPSAEYRVPIYGIPRDLGTARHGAYLSRSEIEQGRMGDRARPMAWVRDPVDAFFLEVEGSGTLRLPGNRELRVGPAATNGRPYRSIGWLLIEEGKIPAEAMTMRALRQWLNEHPEERSRVLRYNESYVFFSPRSGAPVGSLGVPLTPGRSIATDTRIFPRGALAFVKTTRPVEQPDGQVVWKPVSRFVLSQDTGGAIRGPGRVDVFWGRGPEAELAASDMKESGELYFLVPKARESIATWW
ncbi:MAG TPA: MltA domain-containing protein [Candidatus Methylomirabilis sp.]|nr:MltA domain-containing protein [Candidatus Methylomirabilis sp.]